MSQSVMWRGNGVLSKVTSAGLIIERRFGRPLPCDKKANQCADHPRACCAGQASTIPKPAVNLTAMISALLCRYNRNYNSVLQLPDDVPTADFNEYWMGLASMKAH